MSASARPRSPVAGDAPEQIGGLRDGEFRQDHGADLDAFAVEDRQQAVGIDGGDPFPGVGRDTGTGPLAQARRRAVGKLPVEKLERIVEAAAKAQPQRIDEPAELFHHGAQGDAIDRAHRGDFLGQGGLQVVRQIAERKLRAFGDQQPDDDRRLLTP